MLDAVFRLWALFANLGQACQAVTREADPPFRRRAKAHSWLAIWMALIHGTGDEAGIASSSAVGHYGLTAIISHDK